MIIRRISVVIFDVCWSRHTSSWWRVSVTYESIIMRKFKSSIKF